MNSTDILRLENEIICYLDNHPKAADTAIGIAAWWLNENFSDKELNDLQQALTRLLERRVIRVRQSADGNTYYSKA